MTTASLTYYFTRRKAVLFSIARIPLKILYFIGGSLLTVAVIFYVFEMNALIVGTYTVKGYYETLDRLTKENRDLEAKFAEKGFLYDLQQKAVGMQFEKATGVTYIKVLENYLSMELKP